MNRKEILASTLARKQVIIETWGETTIQRFSGVIRDKIDKALDDAAKGGAYSRARAMAIVHSVIDDKSGQLMFAEADIDALSQLDGRVLDNAFGEIARYNGMVADSVEDAEEN